MVTTNTTEDTVASSSGTFTPKVENNATKTKS